jgi:hypothetical protein
MATMKRKAYEGPRPKGPTGRGLDASKLFGTAEQLAAHTITDIDPINKVVTLHRSGADALAHIASKLLDGYDLADVIVALRDKIQRINDERTHLLTNDPEPAEEVIYYLGRAIQHSRQMPGAKNANRE